MKIKFKFTGRDGMVDFNLIQAGILPIPMDEDDSLKKGQIVEIEETHKLVPRLRENSLWVETTRKRAKKIVPKEGEAEKPAPKEKEAEKEENKGGE